MAKEQLMLSNRLPGFSGTPVYHAYARKHFKERRLSAKALRSKEAALAQRHKEESARWDAQAWDVTPEFAASIVALWRVTT